MVGAGKTSILARVGHPIAVLAKPICSRRRVPRESILDRVGRAASRRLILHTPRRLAGFKVGLSLIQTDNLGLCTGNPPLSLSGSAKVAFFHRRRVVVFGSRGFG